MNKIFGGRIRLLVAVVAFGSYLIVAAPVAQARTVVTKCVTDGSFSTRLCMTATYNVLYSRGIRYVQLVSVNGYAQKLDKFASIANLRVGALTSGKCYSGCGYINDGELKANVNNPVLGRSYGGAPSWSRYYTATTGSVYFTCAVAGLKWYIHGQAHTYTADYCVGLQPDALSVSDRERGLS